MPRPALALALCRVSTAEQVENNSLNRQKGAVLKAARELGVTIPDDGWWSGSVSSKRGTNLKRKDLQEMVERCKKDKRIQYVVVDEPDRFMRSIDEAAYFEVTFKQLGVQVWYASDPELNKGDLASKLLKFTKYLSAEGSNEERQRKSISGQTAALLMGKWPFNPKPGYRRGYERGVPEIHPVNGPALQKILLLLIAKQATPPTALIEFNKSEFMKGHAPYKMDKFRKIVTDSFYAGVVEMDRQVKVRNERGLHQPLITLEQHYELVKIMNGRPKNQAGPRKNGNPKYPLNNIMSCDPCVDKKNNRYVGFDHGNGKNPNLKYEKYRCRACGRYNTREEIHAQVVRCFADHPIDREGWKHLAKALDIAWKQEEAQTAQTATRIKHKIKSLDDAIVDQVEAVTDPANVSIKGDILASIAKKKTEIAGLEDELEELTIQADSDKERFLQFAFDFVNNMGSRFLEIPPENRLLCKQIVFPAGFRVGANGKVYTPEISPLITLAANKKGTEVPDFANMVRVGGL